MTDIFEAVRAIPAYEAAERLGVHLTRKGSRQWACCPFHGEKTASLCFYEEGHFYCFGCHSGGSTVDFYQKYYQLDRVKEAAMRAAADFGIMVDDKAPPARPKYTEADLARALEARRSQEETYLCEVKRQAEAIIQAKGTESAWDDPEFCTAMDALTWAKERLDELQEATLDDLAADFLAEEVGK